MTPAATLLAVRVGLLGVSALCFALCGCGSRSPLDQNGATDSPDSAGDAGTRVEPLGCFTKVEAGSSSACALRRDGALFCWGNNARGQLGVITRTIVLEPTRVDTLENVLDVSLGGEFGCALTGDGLHCFGHNNFGQVGAGHTGSSSLPHRVEGLSGELLAFSAGGTHACAVDTNRNLHCWGNNGWGELGLGFVSNEADSYAVNQPAPVNLPGVTHVAAGEVHTCAAQAGVSLYCWGGRASEPAYPSPGPSSPVQGGLFVPPIRKLAAGDEFACVITNDGAPACSGANAYTSPGGATSNPVAGVDTPVVDVACAREHACVATKSGAVLCWGANRKGALGRDPNTGDDPDPVARQVAGIEGHAIGVTVGSDFSCALTREGDVWCWGSQDFGQLGVVSDRPVDSPTPRRVDLECP
jgi:alpha-tubulin suppressor-like RCC1 family protein